MSLILDFVLFGENISGSEISSSVVLEFLKKLETQLLIENHKWQDVSLLIIANSKVLPTQADQIQSDQEIVSALSQFCGERNWFPSLMGASVFSSFFSDGMKLNTNITDGLLLTAVLSPVLERIPVVYEISPNKEARKYAGVNVIEAGLREYRARIKEKYKFDPSPFQVYESSTGILFSTGIGHIESKEFIDFNDSYAIGQEMIERFDSTKVIGGCASNRSTNQFQCLYYSDYINNKPTYKFTYKHAAVFAFLPYSTTRFFLLHPYEIADEVPLKIEFHTRDQYAPGRYFYVKSVNGKAPVDYLSELWQCSKDELYRMQIEHTPIPADPKTYGYTIGSSKSAHDKDIWPNVGGWLEKIDGEVLLRLVRAEDYDSNYFLMSMGSNAIEKNAEHLAEYFESNIGKESSIISFVCESRKYYLNSVNSNVEAETVLSLIPDSTKKIGIYLNGEYSVGTRRSIGYLNFSQSSMIIPNRDISELPFQIFNSIKARSDVKIFISHANRDKAVVRQMMNYMSEDVQKFIFWIDEQKLITGDTLKSVIQKTITEDTNYLIVFISQSSLNSPWVRDEVSWAIQAEITTGRNFILPVLLDSVWKEITGKWDAQNADYFTGKKYLPCLDHTEDGLKLAARRLARDIEEWIKRG